MQRRWIIAGLCLLLLHIGLPLTAQDATTPATTPTPQATVPDVTGLTVPRAQALLNAAGFRLGEVTPVEWTEDTDEKNTIAVQSPAPDDPAEPGTSVTVDVLRDFNVRLEYNQDRFSMINLSGRELTISRVLFQRNDDPDLRLGALSWVRTLRNDQCVQVWAIPTNSFIRPRECDVIPQSGWFVANNPDNFFWFGEDPATFDVRQDNIRRATCPIARDEDFLTCDIYLAPGVVSDDTTSYVYFLYDVHDLYVVNQSQAQWMPLSAIDLNAELRLSNPRLFDAAPVDETGFLAPGQCVRYTDGTPRNDTLPRLSDCSVLATATLDAESLFWREGFSLNSLVLEEEVLCPPVVQSQRTLCLLPR